jgi:IclR family KDG regulon transcriptional repressor
MSRSATGFQMADKSALDRDPGRGSNQVQGAAAFSKFMTVLQTIADAPRGIDIAQLTKATPYPRGTVYRLVAALVAEGLVEQRRDDGTYRLGPRLIQLASKTWETSDLRTVARDFLISLRDATDEVVHLAVPSSSKMVYIDKIEGSNTVQMKTSIGGQVAVHSTSVGKAWLSGLSQERLAEVLAELPLKRHTENTFTDPDALRAELMKSRDQGYAEDNEENEPDIRCVGSPIFNRSGEPVGAISISVPVYRIDPQRHAQIAALVVKTAKDISTKFSTIV